MTTMETMTTTREYSGRLLILTAPLVLGVPEIFLRVQGESTGAFQAAYNDVDWWILLQILQMTLGILLFLAAARIIAGRQGPAVTVSRIALGLFLAFSLANYGVTGIGTSILILHANGLAEAARTCIGPQSRAFESIRDYDSSPIGAVLVVSGSLSWILGLVAAIRQHDVNDMSRYSISHTRGHSDLVLDSTKCETADYNHVLLG